MEEIEQRLPAQMVAMEPSLKARERPRAPAPPPPLPIAAAAGATTTTQPQAQAPIVDGALTNNDGKESSGDASMGGVLLAKRWAVHWMSRMYRFHRHELSSYAHDLVKFLRNEALLAFKREFGYKVCIRHTDAFVAFEVLEEREAGDVNLGPQKQQQQPTGNNQGVRTFGMSSRVRAQTADPTTAARSGFAFAGNAVSPSIGYDPRANRVATTATAARGGGESKDAGEATRQRRGGFVLYFPTEEENEQQQQLRSMAPRKTKERQYVVLLRGNEDLLGCACAWLQTRFQCIVSEQRINISPVNLKWLARNWVVDSLATEESSPLPPQEDNPEKAKQPLLLKYRNVDEQSMVRQYTLTVPWATLRRLCEQSKQADTVPTAIPELIRMTEELYFETLPLNMSAFELESIDMAGISVSQSGRIEFSNMSLVHTVLRGLAELLSIQNVPGPAKPVMTL